MSKIKNEIFRITGIMLLFLVLIVGGAQSQTNINSCTTINVSGDYVLNQDIIGSSNNACIVITSSDVIFNGAGHIIDGSGSSPNGTKGIIVTISDNVTVENTVLKNWEFDILYYGANAGNIIGNNVSLANYGIFLDSSANNLVKNNNASYNGVYGIWLGKGQNSTLVLSNNLLVGNIITRNFDTGVHIDRVGNNTLNNNIILNNGLGVYSITSPSNTLDSNNISNNNLSIRLDSSNVSTVKNNIVSNNGVGIFLYKSFVNTIYNNYFNNNINAIDNDSNIWNVSQTLGTNIIGGPYIGGNFWSDYTGNDTSGDRIGDTLLPYNSSEKINGGDFLPLTMSLGVVYNNVTNNMTVTSDTAGTGTSPSNPIITYVTSPNSGTVTIQISPTTQSAPIGFSFLNQQVDITAPSTNPSSPLIIVFTINSTQLAGQTQDTIQIFKNGNQTGSCPGGTVASPDPCITKRTTLTNGDVQITVLSSNGDPWNIASPFFHKGKITGGGWITITGDPKATFGIEGQYQGSKSAQGNVEYHDHEANLNIKSIQINTVTTTLDNKKGVITGLAQVNDVGSYPFVAYVEDNGEPGKGIDVFKISLPTYPYSNEATLAGGNIQIHS